MAKLEHRKFQVFISATYKDLIVERQAVIKAILDASHIPAGMEFFTSYNEAQLETMYRWIDESDFYLLLLGGSYGTIDDVHDRSYTQLEYEHAMKKKKDVRVVLLSDEYLAEKGITETAEYKKFKEIVDYRSKEIAFTKDGIERAVLKILLDYDRNHDTGGWVRAEYAFKNDNENIFLSKKLEELQKENQKLLEKIRSLEHERIGKYTFDELITTLRKKSIVNEHGETLSLLDVFIRYFNKLSVGFLLDEDYEKQLYGTLSVFHSLGLLWIAKGEEPRMVRTSGNGREFYTKLQLLEC